MRVCLDGGGTFSDAPEGVIVIYDDVRVSAEDEEGHVEFHFSHEGLITDVWADNENVGSDGETIDELVTRLCKED
jgi:hypothetical protein